MGLIICKKHGQQGIYNLCPHIYKQFMSDSLIDNNFIEKKDEIGSVIYMCDSCIHKYNLQSKELLDFDDIQNLDDDFGAGCNKCVDNFLKK